jgi:glucose/arabinose dehydrogenase
MRIALVAAVALLAAPACVGAAALPPTRTGLRLERVATGLDHPTHLAAPAGDPRLFVVEQPGRIRIVRSGRVLPRPFLDIRDRVGWGGERGLLSVAFHPRFRENGFLFVDYTDRHGDTRIVRFHANPGADIVDPGTAKLLLTIPQPYANHNGGLVLFAPDGMMWIGMGDGGSAGDPHLNGQNPESLLGKMLRIDVDHGDPYAIPRDNPFAHGGGRPEIWAMGLRNPWRYAFDVETGLLYIADVGQDDWEEVDVAPAAQGGLNYGWNRMEGSHPFRPVAGDTARLVAPVYEYSHAEGCSITGGAVYRGTAAPALRGCYFFSDYCQGWLRSFRYAGGRVTDLVRWRIDDAGAPSSFGTDGQGELYLVSLDGRVFRIVAGRSS